jgi:hypothetical protein
MEKESTPKPKPPAPRLVCNFEEYMQYQEECKEIFSRSVHSSGSYVVFNLMSPSQYKYEMQQSKAYLQKEYKFEQNRRFHELERSLHDEDKGPTLDVGAEAGKTENKSNDTHEKEATKPIKTKITHVEIRIGRPLKRPRNKRQDVTDPDELALTVPSLDPDFRDSAPADSLPHPRKHTTKKAKSKEPSSFSSSSHSLKQYRPSSTLDEVYFPQIIHYEQKLTAVLVGCVIVPHQSDGNDIPLWMMDVWVASFVKDQAMFHTICSMRSKVSLVKFLASHGFVLHNNVTKPLRPFLPEVANGYAHWVFATPDSPHLLGKTLETLRLKKGSVLHNIN